MDLIGEILVLIVGGLLGGIGTYVRQLLTFLRDEGVEALIRARAADALSALELKGLMAEVRALVTDERVEPLVRGRAARCLAQDKDGVDWLIELLEREDIAQEVYLALYHASRQAGVRVFVRPEGGYEASPLQSTQMQ